MTDPTGQSFLSYRRTRTNDARKLIEAQHDVGIPTWQDLIDLGEGHTDDQIRTVLTQDSIANAIAYVTPDVAVSAVITRTELPGIVNRVDRKDAFFLVPVAAGGADYGDVTTIAGTYLGTHDLSQWNVSKVGSDPISDADAANIARRVLKSRIQALHKTLEKDAPLKIQVHTRKPPANGLGCALVIDWTHRFHGREAEQAIWNRDVIPAAEAVAQACGQFAPGRPIAVEGFCAIPAAVALGAAFLAPRGIRATWHQMSATLGNQTWALAINREASGFSANLQSANASADDIAVLVSVASDVTAAFGATRPSLPPFRAIVSVNRPGSTPHDIGTPGQATDIAQIISSAIRKAREDYQARGVVHLFLAVPVGLAFMLGQSLNTLGAVQTYEHIPIEAVGSYRPAALLKPGS